MFSLLNRILFKNPLSFITLIFLLSILIFVGIAHPLAIPDEGRYAGIALEMYQSGNYLTPTLNGMPFFHKPILYFALTELSYSFFGVNFITARLASWFAIALLVLVSYQIIKAHLNRGVANLAALMILSSAGIFVALQYANTDPLVGAMISCAILSAVHAVFLLEDGRSYKRWIYITYIFAALGLLSKGLIGIFLPGLVVLLWLIVSLRFKAILLFLNWRAIVLFLLISLPWFIYMEITNPGFLEHFFIYHHFHRFTDNNFNNPQPWWFYISLIPLLVLPWSLNLIYLFKKSNKQIIWNKKQQSLLMLLLIWLIVIVAFFSIPHSKLVGYIIPALPPVLILLAWLGYYKAYPKYLLDKEPQEVNSAEQDTTEEVELSNTPQSSSKFNLISALWLLSLILQVAIIIFFSFSERALSARSSYLVKEELQQTIKGIEVLNKINSYKVVAIGYYPYDFAFNFGYKGTMPVVYNWQEFIAKPVDNWAGEMLDAKLFAAPEVIRKTFIENNDLKDLICNIDKELFIISADDTFDKLTNHKFTSLTTKPALFKTYLISNPKSLTICN